MIKKNHTIFPTLVNEYEDFLSVDQCKDVCDFLYKNNSYDAHEAFDGNAISSHKKNNIIEEIDNNVQSCNGIINNINLILNDYANDSGIIDLQLSNSWYNIQYSNSYLKNHIHQASVLSAALYIKIDDKSSNLYFENPNQFVDFTNFNNKRFTEFTYTNYSFVPKNGLLIVFPSWLKHGSHYERNFSEERVVISFNSIYK